MQGLGSRVQGSGFRVQGSGFRVQGSGFRVQGLGCRVYVDFAEGWDEGQVEPPRQSHSLPPPTRSESNLGLEA